MFIIEIFQDYLLTLSVAGFSCGKSMVRYAWILSCQGRRRKISQKKWAAAPS